MGPRRCYILGCKSGYRIKSLPVTYDCEKRTLFKPRSIQQLEIWRRSIPRNKKEMAMTDVICEKHFTEEDIIRYYETKMPDGRIWKLAKGMPGLKKNAVPKLHLGLANNFKQASTQNKLSAVTKVKQEIISDDSEDATVSDRNVISIKKETKTDSENVIIADLVEIKEEIDSDDDIGASITEDDVGTSVAEEVETLNFNILVDRVKDISKPNASWGITAHDDFVICAKWDENFSLERRVTIDNDLKVKMFLANRSIEVGNIDMDSLTDLSNFLQEVDSYILCLGVNDVKRTGCDICVPSRSYCQFCQTCNNEECNEEDIVDENKAIARDLSKRIKALDKKNERSKRQVTELQEKVLFMKTECANMSKEIKDLGIE